MAKAFMETFNYRTYMLVNFYGFSELEAARKVRLQLQIEFGRSQRNVRR